MLVIIAEDDQELRGLMLDIFRDADCETEAFDNGAAAFEFLKQKRPASEALLVTDLMMPEMDGVDLVRKLAGLGIRIPTVVVSGYLNDKVKARMERFGAMAVLAKPVEVTVLQGLIEQAASFQPPAPAIMPEAEPEPAPPPPVQEQETSADVPQDEAASEKASGAAAAEAAESAGARGEAAASEEEDGVREPPVESDAAGMVEASEGAGQAGTTAAAGEQSVEQGDPLDIEILLEQADETWPAEGAEQARAPAQRPSTHAPTVTSTPHGRCTPAAR